MPASTGPLHAPNFRLLFASRAISYFGTSLAPIAVAFAVLDLTGSASDTGIAFACWTLAQISTLLVGGVVADRLPRRLVMVSSETANFLVRATMGALLISGHARIWEIFVLQAIGGAATAFYSPASSGLVPEVVAAEHLQKANALMGIARYVSFPVGAAVGGSIVATIGSGTAVLVDAATYAVSAALLSQIHLGPRVARVVTPSFVRELREGWQAFTEQTWIWLLTVWIALYFLVTYAPFFVLGPYIAKHSLGGPGAWAIVVTGEGIGALGGALLGLRIQPRHPWRIVGPVFALTAVQSVLLAAHASVAAIGAAAVLAGFLVFVRLGDLRDRASAGSAPREARSCERLQLDGVHDLLAARLCDRGLGRHRHRQLHVSARRRDLDRRDDPDRRLRARRPRFPAPAQPAGA